MPPVPQNKLEEIMCDADLDYLGRVDFVPVSNMLFRELVEHEAIENDVEKWNNLQVEFISGHQYFTQSAKILRDVNKQKQLENIRNLAN
jgi:adenylate cyclase